MGHGTDKWSELGSSTLQANISVQYNNKQGNRSTLPLQSALKQGPRKGKLQENPNTVGGGKRRVIVVRWGIVKV